MARPTKINTEIEHQICQLIRAGNVIDTAAEAAGIAVSTYFNWMERGLKEKDGPYHDFREAVERARAEAQALLVGRVQKAAASGSWRAACWLLERGWPEDWASLPERSGGHSDLDRELELLTK